MFQRYRLSAASTVLIQRKARRSPAQMVRLLGRGGNLVGANRWAALDRHENRLRGGSLPTEIDKVLKM
jgi:hypothetical protein